LTAKSLLTIGASKHSATTLLSFPGCVGAFCTTDSVFAFVATQKPISAHFAGRHTARFAINALAIPNHEVLSALRALANFLEIFFLWKYCPRLMIGVCSAIFIYSPNAIGASRIRARNSLIWLIHRCILSQKSILCKLQRFLDHTQIQPVLLP
jgi:hypothetical protein